MQQHDLRPNPGARRDRKRQIYDDFGDEVRYTLSGVYIDLKDVGKALGCSVEGAQRLSASLIGSRWLSIPAE